MAEDVAVARVGVSRQERKARRKVRAVFTQVTVQSTLTRCILFRRVYFVGRN